METSTRALRVAPRRRILERLRELGRRLGDAVEQGLRQPDVGQVPVTVPADDQRDAEEARRRRLEGRG